MVADTSTMEKRDDSRSLTTEEAPSVPMNPFATPGAQTPDNPFATPIAATPAASLLSRRPGFSRAVSAHNGKHNNEAVVVVLGVG